MQYIQKPIEKYGVILQRVFLPGTNYTVVETNVPHHIVYHSPTGFEWGYAGSGPSELALNLAELVVQKAELETDRGVHCSMLAWGAKHKVKKLLIVNLPEEGGIIPWKLVCYAVMDYCSDENRARVQKYIDRL